MTERTIYRALEYRDTVHRNRHYLDSDRLPKEKQHGKHGKQVENPVWNHEIPNAKRMELHRQDKPKLSLGTASIFLLATYPSFVFEVVDNRQSILSRSGTVSESKTPDDKNRFIVLMEVLWRGSDFQSIRQHLPVVFQGLEEIRLENIFVRSIRSTLKSISGFAPLMSYMMEKTRLYFSAACRMY